jgi:hypothetical protein
MSFFFLMLLLCWRASASSCGRGQYVRSPNVCTDCPFGTYISSTSHSMKKCFDCPRGKYADATGQYECHDCQPAKYADRVGQTECTTCRADSYLTISGATSASDCLSCNEAKIWSITNNRFNGTDNVDHCVCGIGRVDYGSERVSKETDRCQQCPEGGACEQRHGIYLETLNSSKGWWRPSFNSTRFYSCISQHDCAGGGSLPYNASFMNISMGNETELIWKPDFQCVYGSSEFLLIFVGFGFGFV